MEEGLQSIFYILLAILFWLGPALLRWLRKRSGATPSMDAGEGDYETPEPMPFEEPEDSDPFGWDEVLPEEPEVPDFAAMARRQREALAERSLMVLRAQRAHSTRGGELALFDKAAADLFAPYAALLVRHHPAMASPRVRVLEGPWESAEALLEPAAGSVTVALPDGAADRPMRMSLLAGSTARVAVESCPGLLGEARKTLGLPDPEASAAYLAATGRLTIPALVSAWLPVLLADVLAAAQMGPAYVSSLSRSTGRSVERNAALRANVGFGGVIGDPPLHVRMYVACLALDRLGRGEEGGARWNRWIQVLGHPGSLVIKVDGSPAVPVDAEQVLSTAAPVVDGLIRRGLASLGGLAPSRIPGLAVGEQEWERIGSVATGFNHGVSAPERPRLILAAATIAAEMPGHVESRVRKAALDSLAGKRPVAVRSAAASRGGLDTPPADFAALLRTPGFAARAVVMAAAISPRRGGRQLA